MITPDLAVTRIFGLIVLDNLLVKIKRRSRGVFVWGHVLQIGCYMGLQARLVRLFEDEKARLPPEVLFSAGIHRCRQCMRIRLAITRN
jgi:hypothetical protein